jgi:superfamily II DNA or RNA helicase
MSSILRPYQDEGERAIFAAWKEGHRNVMYQLCTGGGKTVLFVDIIKKFILAKKRVVLVAHREELITQAWNTLYKNQIFAGIIKADVAPNYSLLCQVASIQTLARRKNIPFANETALVIFDEAHHSQDDNSYGNVLIDLYPNARVLGVTATPYRLGGKGFTDLYEILITGPTFKQLVAWGYLTPLRYFVASRPDLTRVTVSKGDYVIEEAANVMKLAPVVESYKEHADGLCGLVFAVNVDHSNKIVSQYTAAGIPALHVDANTDSRDRKSAFDALRERRVKIVSNVGIATEGTDIPNIDFTQLVRPTKSLSLFLQMVGRVTRPIWDEIKHALTDEERAFLLSRSSKPCGLVLDNAGLWEEHGLPDQNIDWQRYFVGRDKREKKKPEEIIEMIEFVAEDEDGGRVVTRIPKEVEGLKLIEVNTIVKERIVNITSLKEFDKGLEMFKRMPKLGSKAGFAALNNYRDYCRKNSILMSSEIWDYIIQKLHTEPEQKEADILAYHERNVEQIKQQFLFDEGDRDRMIKEAERFTAMKIEPFKKYKVPIGYLKKEKAAYLQSASRIKEGADLKGAA